MNIKHCPSCGSARLELASRSEAVEFKGLEVYVRDVQSTRCADCDYTFASPSQHDKNVAAARAAHVSVGAAAKQSKGLLSGAQLRAIREALGLSQKEAAELFGGGPVAFSKYENEVVAQSVAMDRLVRVVHHMGKLGVHVLREVAASKVADEKLQANPLRRSETVVVMEVGAQETLQGARHLTARAASGHAIEMPVPRGLIH